MIEPPPNQWAFPDARQTGPDEVAAVGADLEPGTLLAAYRSGLFPMRAGRELAWWSPDPRGIMPLDGFHVSRSLARVLNRFEIRVNTAFVDVMRACADRRRPHGWIDASFIAAYTHLHEIGWAHSVEAWQDGVLAGAVYGVRIGGLFAGESMFHRVTNASKVALWATVELLRLDGATLFDVQWATQHLKSLGVVEISRAEYLERLSAAVTS